MDLNEEVIRINEDLRLNLSTIGNIDNATSCDDDDESVSSFQRTHKILMQCPTNDNTSHISSSNHSVDKT